MTLLYLKHDKFTIVIKQHREKERSYIRLTVSAKIIILQDSNKQETIIKIDSVRTMILFPGSQRLFYLTTNS